MPDSEYENGDSGRGHQSGGRLVPIPDPTALTAKLVANAINDFRREMQTRFDAMDKAANLLHEDYTRVPTQVDRAVLNIRELVEAKIENLQKELKGQTERLDMKISGMEKLSDSRLLSIQNQATQESTNSKEAVYSALQAAKEAVAAQNESNAVAMNKSEAALTKQIDAMNAIVAASTKALDDKITYSRDRIQAIESRGQGLNQGWGYIVGAFGVIVGIVTAAGFVIHAMH